MTLQATPGGWRGEFSAMASPCSVLLDGPVDADLAQTLVGAAQAEAQRIERKYSRYREDSVLSGLHRQPDLPQQVDDETADLLDFAAQCHALSEGLFDISTGVLRRAWRFDGAHAMPDAATLADLLPRVGWHRVHWARPWLTLPAGMALDLGGLGKEYAVDRTLALLQGLAGASGGPAPALLVNFGGDLACNGPRADGSAWQVGIEAADRPMSKLTPGAGDQPSAGLLHLRAGALATSGDTHRHVLHQGRRLGHVLDPRTGWPVAHAPRSVTVAASHCTEAGLLATLALLQGAKAQDWLQAQGVAHWVQW